MLLKLTQQNLSLIKNSDFRQYALIYARVYDHFIEQVKSTGMELDENLAEETRLKLEHLKEKQANFRNSGKSIITNWISSACEDAKMVLVRSPYMFH